MMYLRMLKPADAPLMLEWMHDENVIHDLNTDFASKTLEDARCFIEAAQDTRETLHLAIASDSDEYMGTVTLRHIDHEAGTAEFAITVRTKSMRKGYSWYGMKSILEKAFFELGLRQVYWCVSVQNTRAIRFYDKHGFRETAVVPNAIMQRYRDVNNLKWYAVDKKHYPLVILP